MADHYTEGLRSRGHLRRYLLVKMVKLVPA